MRHCPIAVRVSLMTDIDTMARHSLEHSGLPPIVFGEQTLC